jgi:hypothetical protein
MVSKSTEYRPATKSLSTVEEPAFAFQRPNPMRIAITTVLFYSCLSTTDVPKSLMPRESLGY